MKKKGNGLDFDSVVLQGITQDKFVIFKRMGIQ